MTDYRIATTPAEVLAITQIRYDVYVEEMNVYVGKADHENRLFTDARDETDRLLYAVQDDGVIGAISLVVGADAPFSPDLRRIYDLDRFEQVVPEAAIGAAIRLVVRPDLRSSRLPFRLMSKSMKEFVSAGVSVLFCTCQPHLINMYRRLGFESYEHGIYDDPEFGIMVPLILVMSDVERLKSIRSPLASICAKGTYAEGVTEGIRSVMGGSTVLQAEGDEVREHLDLWSDEEREHVTFLEGLCAEQVARVVAAGELIDCTPGQRVIAEGQQTDTLFVPLSGDLHVKNGRQLIAIIHPGELLGEMSFLNGSRRLVDVFAGDSGAKVLSLCSRNLRNLLDVPDALAVRLWRNMSQGLALRLSNTTSKLKKEPVERFNTCMLDFDALVEG